MRLYLDDDTAAPLLAKLLVQQEATGLPPPYLPKDELTDNEGEAP